MSQAGTSLSGVKKGWDRSGCLKGSLCSVRRDLPLLVSCDDLRAGTCGDCVGLVLGLRRAAPRTETSPCSETTCSTAGKPTF